MSAPATARLQPATRLGSLRAYRSGASMMPRESGGILDLSANEGAGLDIAQALESIDSGGTIPRRYPDATRLEQLIAARLGVPARQVIVTAGADDALFRLAMSVLEPGRSAVTTAPTFEMIPRYIALTGGEERSVPWLSGSFPMEALQSKIDKTTTCAFVVSPNNPTGASISGEELRVVRGSIDEALLILDQAYAEFAREDLSSAAIAMPRVVVTRTLSKAWGLAGLRVGYAVGDPEVIGWLRSAGNPYSVSSLSLAIAEWAIGTCENEMRKTVDRSIREREALTRFLVSRGIRVIPSDANFVLADFGSAEHARHVFERLLAVGVLVRVFPAHPILSSFLRMTCPLSDGDLDRLLSALDSIITTEGAWS